MVLALLLTVVWDRGLTGVFTAQLTANAVAMLLGLIAISDSLTFRVFAWNPKDAFAYSLPLFPAVFANWANNQANRIILLSFMGLGVVGVFGAAVRIASIMGLALNVFRQAWVPLSMECADNPKVREKFYQQVFSYYVCSMTLLALGLVAFSKELLAILVPEEYHTGYCVIPWLIGAAVLHGTGSFTNLGMVISKRTFGNSIAAWSGVLVNISLCLVLIPWFGLPGAGIGWFLAELVFTTILWHFSRRVSDISMDTRRATFAFVCYVVTSVSLLGIHASVDDPVHSVLLRVFVFSVSATLIIRLYVDQAVVARSWIFTKMHNECRSKDAQT